MATSKQIKTSHQARLSKLQSKKQQLVQLLRKRARIDFEINTLKKSISKEQKRTLREQKMLVEELNQQDLHYSNREVLLESLDIAESEDPEEAYVAFKQIDKELNLILRLLLEFDESLIQN